MCFQRTFFTNADLSLYIASSPPYSIFLIMLNAMSFDKFCRFTLFNTFPETCAKEDANLSIYLSFSGKTPSLCILWNNF